MALTYNEVEGMEWFYEVKDSENIIVPLSQIGRFHDLFDDGGSDIGSQYRIISATTPLIDLLPIQT